MALRSARPFDLVVYGATGFTGRLTAAYVAQHAPPSLKWALGGRSVERLSALKTELAASYPAAAGIGIVIGEGATAVNVARSCRAVVTTAGPFALYGEPLLAACAEHGTDYCDLTGEPFWVGRMLAKYEAAARASGAIICCMAGFDSVPADIGTFYMARHARVAHGVRINDVTALVRTDAGMSGGTVASGLNTMREPGGVEEGSDPLLLFPGHVTGAAPTPAELAVVAPAPDAVAPFEIKEGSAAGRWAAFFPMAPINSRVVRRSAGILATRGGALAACRHALPPLRGAGAGAGSDGARYSAGPFHYGEFMPARSWLTAKAINASVEIGRFALATLPGALALASRLLPQPGQGPTAEQRAAARWSYELVARVEGRSDGAVIIGRISGGDPGYGDTAQMLAEAGLALAQQRAELPGAALGGGFLTPATAFGGALLERLQARGSIKFELVRDDLAPPAGKGRATRKAKAGQI